jgi:hypothetical protein
MIARFGWSHTDTTALETVLATYEARVVPEVAAKDGFLGTFAGVDRATAGSSQRRCGAMPKRSSPTNATPNGTSHKPSRQVPYPHQPSSTTR